MKMDLGWGRLLFLLLLIQKHLSLGISVWEHHIAEGLKNLGNIFSFLRFRLSFLVIAEEKTRAREEFIFKKRGFGISTNLWEDREMFHFCSFEGQK